MGMAAAALALAAQPAQSQAPVAASTPPPASTTVPLTDAIARFGALEAVSDVSLSPDGNNIAFIAPEPGRGNSLFVVGTAEGSPSPRRVTRASGDPERLQWCGWANNTRLVCRVTGREIVGRDIFGFSTMIAISADGSNPLVLSRRRGSDAQGLDLRGGSIVDWLPSDPDHILMARTYVPEARIGSLVARTEDGMGVDRVDINSGAAQRVVPPRREAEDYISDGDGNVRVLAVAERTTDGYLTGMNRFLTRPVAGGAWTQFATYLAQSRAGFIPAAVDPDTGRIIGYSNVDGRTAVVSLAADGSGPAQTMFSHPEVDIDGILLTGSNRRVVGATFVTERRQAIVTDGQLRTMTNALSRALGGRQVQIVDATSDNSTYIVLATADTDAGRYYLYRPALRQLRPLLDIRPQLAEMPLSAQQSIRYPAADGTMIPAYLTLPRGHSDVRGLPTIVMPHGGPDARDEWGFDWLVQFLASQGYAVVQPNYRGSAGYGEQWYVNNGFQSWRTAVGDITDAGRWLVSQGADPARVSIVGWSYGGYAALQSGVIAPDLFRSIVAIAPVTDLVMLKATRTRYADARLYRDFIGEGPHVRDGSPAMGAELITAPVLMFHGTEDQNVDIEQSRRMRNALNAARHPAELIEYPGLAHGLESSTARADMLTRIAAFLPH